MRRHRYSEAEREFLRENAPGAQFDQLAEAFNSRFGLSLGVSQVVSACYRFGAKTGRDAHVRNLQEAGRPFRFQPGHTPYNKGLKGVGGWEPTWFAKGQIPANYRPVGSERVTVDGYTEVKTAEPKTWRAKHVVVWESLHGPVPKGRVVTFGDGNRMNFDPGNLVLMTRRELAAMNKRGLFQDDADLTRSALQIARLGIAVRDRLLHDPAHGLRGYQKYCRENQRRRRETAGPGDPIAAEARRNAMAQKVFCLLDNIEISSADCPSTFSALDDPSEITVCRNCEHHSFTDAAPPDASARDPEVPAADAKNVRTMRPDGHATSPSGELAAAVKRGTRLTDDDSNDANSLRGSTATMVEHPTVQAVLSELARRTGTAIATVSYCYYKQREGKKPAKGSTGERLLAWLSAQGLSWKDVADCRFLSADDPGVTVDAASPADAGASSARPDPPRPDSDPSLPAAPAACGAPMADHLEDLLARIRNVLPRGAKIIIEL